VVYLKTMSIAEVT